MAPLLSLRDTRLAQELRLVDVARRAGCSISLVSMVESGYRPSEVRQAAIAAAVGATVGSFWPDR